MIARAIKWLLPFFVVLLSFAIYRVSWTFDLRKQVNFKGQELCSVVEAPTFSHFVRVGDIILASSPQAGAIYHVIDTPFVTTKIDLENWPSHPFTPQGLEVFESEMLYVANSAGGTVEVFRVNRSQTGVRLIYERTIELAGDFEGQLHSLVVTTNEELYVTESLPSTSQSENLLGTLGIAARLAFSKASTLQRCTRGPVKFMCESVLTGSQLQGLYFDGAYLFIADAGKKEIVRYKRKKDGTIRERNRFSVGFSPIQLHSYNGILHAVGHANFYEAFTHNSESTHVVSGVVAEITKAKRDWISTEVLVENLASGACSVVKTANGLIVGHCLEQVALVCPVDK